MLGLILLLGACGARSGPEPTLECPEPGRVAQGSVLLVNAYYLQEEATRDLRLGLGASPHLEEIFQKARALGVQVVRTSAFNDDPARAGDTAIQLAPLVYDETSWRGLDLVLARAAAYGLKLVLPLGNYWSAYGGAQQYVAWAGLPEPVEGDPRFFTDAGVRAHYLRHVQNLLARVNTVDGLPYAGHPSVLAWELLNEPRGKGLDPFGLQMRAWVDEVARTVKAADPKSLVSTGEEGFDVSYDGYDASYWKHVAPRLFNSGSSFTSNLASPWVDLASVHLYPELWGARGAELDELGIRWLSEHDAIARAQGKRLLVGEFGLKNFGGYPLDLRRDTYATWLRCARRLDATAVGPWLLSYDARPDNWDPFTFYFKDGTRPEDPANRYADLLLRASRDAE